MSYLNMFSIILLFLIGGTATLYAVEPEVVQQVVESGNWWQPIIALILTAVLAWVGKHANDFLDSRAETHRKEAIKHENDTWAYKQHIATAALYDAVSLLNESEIPELVKLAKKGLVDKKEAKEYLQNLRDRAVEVAATELAPMGISLVGEFGIDWVHNKVRNIVDERSPFLGPTVDALFSFGRERLTAYGQDLLGGLGIFTDGDDKTPEEVITE